MSRKVADNLYFIHFSIVCGYFIVHRFCVTIKQKEPKCAQKKGLVNLIYYEVINKKSGGGVELFELTWKNVYGRKTLIQNFIMSLNPLPTSLFWGPYTHVHRNKALEGACSTVPVNHSFLRGVGCWEGKQVLSLSFLNSEPLAIFTKIMYNLYNKSNKGHKCL